jgi:hypothetical protein
MLQGVRCQSMGAWSCRKLPLIMLHQLGAPGAQWVTLRYAGRHRRHRIQDVCPAALCTKRVGHPWAFFLPPVASRTPFHLRGKMRGKLVPVHEAHCEAADQCSCPFRSQQKGEKGAVNSQACSVDGLTLSDIACG